MHSQTTHTAKSIRFRRWSRAGYAIFCSLACCVSIGSVAISISDKSLQKSVVTISARLIKINSDTEQEELDLAELDAILQNNQELSVIQTTVDSAAACGQTLLSIFIHHSG